MPLYSPLMGLYMTMAVSLIDQCHLLYSFVLFFILCDRLYLELAVASQKVALTSGPHLYHKCEELIRKEVAKIEVKELDKDARLIRVFNTSEEGVSTFFTKDDTSLSNPIFSWKSINLTGIEEIIIIGANDSREGSLEQYMPYGWMTGAFMTMKKVNASITKRVPSAELKVDYYALVAYVRKDAKGRQDLKLEWDRWSRNIANKLLHRPMALEAAQDFSLQTFLCAYGSCSCAACDCKSKKTNAKGTGRAISSGSKEVSKINASKGTSQNPKQPKKPSEAGTKPTNGTSPKTKEKVESDKTANATAYSKNGKAHAASLSDGKSSAHSEAKSSRNHAISESSASMGQSTTYASGFSEVLSESSSRTGDSQSMSKTNDDGFAQAGSQSYGGGVTAAALKEGESETEYDYDYSNSTEDTEENFDPESLVKDTNKAFSKANHRFQKHKPRSKRSVKNKCSMESATEENLTLVEWELLLSKENASNVDPKGHVKDPIFLYQSPLRYGIDVDVGVNTSVLITSATPGYTAPQASCCNLTVKASSTVGKFLSRFRQDCNPDLQSQVRRLEKSFNDSNLAKLLKRKKLDPNQAMDLVPMVLLRIFTNQTLRKSIPIISALYKNRTSEDINLIALLVIHAAHYTTKDGHLHKVKILKQLVLNVKTVLTGILLETKKCQKETKLCSKMVVRELRNERRLVIGLYMFLKFSESRFSYFSNKDPVNYFANFMKLHKTSINSLAKCKSKRITDISASLK